MPDFIDLTLRIRKEKLGDVVTDLPFYCQPIRWTVVREVPLSPPKKVKVPISQVEYMSPDMQELLAPPKRKMKSRCKILPETINEVKNLRKQGMKVVDIAAKLKISDSAVYKATRGDKS